MDEFTRQYLTAALWSSNDESRDDGGDPMDDNYGIEDIAPESIERAEKDCDRFREQAGKMLKEHPDPRMGAHDFWLTRNGYGVGFWDGDWPVNGDALTALAKLFEECWMTLGDDGQIWID